MPARMTLLSWALVVATAAATKAKVSVVAADGNLAKSQYCKDSSTAEQVACGPPPESLYQLGGGGGSVENNSAENNCKKLMKYDPTVGGDWQEMPDAPSGHDESAVVACNGKLYAIGGYQCGGDGGSMDVYDPISNSWTTGPRVDDEANWYQLNTDTPTPNDRYTGYRATFACATCVDDLIYLVGMWANLEQGKGSSVFSTTTNRWSRIAPTSHDRMSCDAVAIAGKVYTVGAWGGDGRYKAMEVYDPSTNLWSDVTSTPPADFAQFPSGAVIDGEYYIDGQGSAFMKYNPSTDSWTSLAPTPNYERTGATSIGSKMYVVGGRDHNEVSSADASYLAVYDTDTSEWSVTDAMLPPTNGIYSHSGGRMVAL